MFSPDGTLISAFAVPHCGKLTNKKQSKRYTPKKCYYLHQISPEKKRCLHAKKKLTRKYIERPTQKPTEKQEMPALNLTRKVACIHQNSPGHRAACTKLTRNKNTHRAVFIKTDQIRQGTACTKTHRKRRGRSRRRACGRRRASRRGCRG